MGDQVDLRFPDRTSAAGEVRSLTLGVDTAVRIADIAFVETDDAEGDEEEGGVGRTFEGVTVDVTWDEIVAIDVLTIPADTFRHLDDGTYVVDVRADDGTIVALAVEPGRQVGTSVEVAAIPVDAEIVQR